MLLTFYLLFFGLHVSDECTLENTAKMLKITGHTGGSVVLPCYCTDLHTTPETFTWSKLNPKTTQIEEISSESGQYRNRVQLVNGHSPGNLSLLISHLTEEDEGDYWCEAKNQKYVFIKLTVKDATTFQTTPFQTTASSMYSFIIIPVLLLLLGLGGVIYWKCRGQRQGQMKSAEQRGTRREQETQDQVTYSTVVHSNTTGTPTVIDAGDKTEYVTIRLN